MDPEAEAGHDRTERPDPRQRTAQAVDPQVEDAGPLHRGLVAPRGAVRRDEGRAGAHAGGGRDAGGPGGPGNRSSSPRGGPTRRESGIAEVKLMTDAIERRTAFMRSLRVLL